MPQSKHANDRYNNSVITDKYMDRQSNDCNPGLMTCLWKFRVRERDREMAPEVWMYTGVG